MNKRILLLCDFSKNSWHAIDYAVTILAEYSCDFFILNTYPTEHLGVSGNYLLDPDKLFNEMAQRRSLAELGHILSKVTFEFENPRHNFNVLSRPGPFLETVKNVIDELDIELVVLGAKGINYHSESTYGCKALQILNNISKCLVLVVPIKWDTLCNGEILFLAYPEINTRTKQLTVFAKIAASHNATIRISNPGVKVGVNSVLNLGFWNQQVDVKHYYLQERDGPFADTRSGCEQRKRWALIVRVIRKPRFFSFFNTLSAFQQRMPNFEMYPILLIHE